MKKYIITVLSICLLFSFLKTAAQSSVSVSPLTGSLNVDIPLYTIRSGQVVVPITLSYYSSGIKTKDVEGTAGIGWQVNAGGQISRQVRGIPDDVVKDQNGNGMYGWISNTNTYNNISNFTIQNDGGATCSKETSDINYINTNLLYNYDTEPDVFTVNAPGLSCQLICNQFTKTFWPVKYQDITIAYDYDSTNGGINSFTITNDRGLTYFFNVKENVVEKTVGTPSYFSTKNKQYQNGIAYVGSWNLTSITDANGNSVSFNYTPAIARNSTDPVDLYLPGATEKTHQYDDQLSLTAQMLSSISTSNVYTSHTQLTFAVTNTNGVLGPLQGTGQTIITAIKGMGHNFTFNYSTVSTAGGSYKRFFLRSFTDPGCNSPVNYQFAYSGETLSPTTAVYSTVLPDTATFKMDYWGYYSNNSNTSLQPKVSVNPSNGSYQRYAIYGPTNSSSIYPYTTTTGSSRAADPANCMAGSLSSITYAYGGTTSIVYESDKYIDGSTGQEATGGGVRVASITDNDVSNPALTRNYTYTDPSTGLSSGKPITLPQFAFTVPYSGAATGSALWNANTILSDNDLSDEDHSVVYKYFKESRTGRGSTLYQYYLPATNWDNTAIPACSGCTTAEWAPTVDLVARNNCTSTYGPIKNQSYGYPFIPNTNYDFERGLIQNITVTNDNGNKVSESAYTYLRSYPPTVLNAFKSDDNVNGALSIKCYNKYQVFYDTGELTYQVTSKIYDLSATPVARTTTVTNVYGSTTHKLLTQQSILNSDNSTLTSNFRYIKDYTTAAAGSNPNVNAIYNLQQLHINAPIESWQQVTRSGTTTTTAASLTLFKDYPGAVAPSIYLPSSQWKMVTADGGTFTPFSISGQAVTKDSKYIQLSNFDNYDLNGYLITADNTNKQYQTAITDHSSWQTTAAFSNAQIGEIGFSDFDTDAGYQNDYEFTINGSGSFTPNGSHAGNAYGMVSTQTLTKTITRNTTSKNYIFSIWINAATAGTLTLTPSSGTPASYTKSFTTGGWKYYEIKMASAALPSSFSVTVSTNQSISIDDVLLYPDVAQATTATFDPLTYLKTSQTNTNGVSAYYQSDPWGRLLYAFDQDNNIVEKKSYYTSAATSAGQGVLTVDYTLKPATATASLNFVAAISCVTAVTYQWNFGDGTTIPATLNGSNQTHTYATAGNYTVTVTATHPSFGTQTYNLPISVGQPIITPQICLSGVKIWNTCSFSAVSTSTCPPNPFSNTASYYTESTSGNVVGTISYQWQISTDNGTHWTNNDGTTYQYMIEHDEGSTPYLIRCVVTTSSGQTGTSNTISLGVVTHC